MLETVYKSVCSTAAPSRSKAFSAGNAPVSGDYLTIPHAVSIYMLCFYVSSISTSEYTQFEFS